MATIKYIHPHVVSEIIDNSHVEYATGKDVTSLFAVFTSEKGLDNTVQFIDSAEKLVSEYGEPNIKLYGQTLYNVENWLKAGGSAYCLRVLPMDAGYSNSILSVKLTKSGDDLVVEDIVQSIASNISSESINSYVKDNIDSSENSVTYPILGFYSRGRGEAYNNIGVKISLNTMYDGTYSFRVYNINVVKFTDSGKTIHLEGPFSVSFDPNGYTKAGSVLYVEDIINEQSKYIRVKCNYKNIETVANRILEKSGVADYNPMLVDIFSLQNRKIKGIEEKIIGEKVYLADISDSSVTDYENRNNAIVELWNNYYEAYTLLNKCAELGIHYKKLPEFDENTIGTLVSDILNLKPAELSTVQGMVISNKANEVKDKVTALLNCFRKLNKYSAFLDKTGKVPTEGEDIKFNSAVLAELGEIPSAIYELTNEYNEYNRYMNLLVDNEKMIEQLRVRASKIFVSESVSDIVNFGEEITEMINNVVSNFGIIESALNIEDEKDAEAGDKVTLKTAKKITTILELNGTKAALTDYANALENYIYLSDNGKKSLKEDILEQLNSSPILLTETFAKTCKIEELKESFLVTINTSTLGTLVEKSTGLDTASIYKSNIHLYEQVSGPDGSVDKYDIEGLYLGFINNAAGESGIQLFSKGFNNKESNSIDKNVIEQIVETTFGSKFSSGVFNFVSNLLVDINSDYIQFKNGTDGSFKNKTVDSIEVISELIAGYSGMVDNSVLEKDSTSIDLILDANYPIALKAAIVDFVKNSRPDVFAIFDTENGMDFYTDKEYRTEQFSIDDYHFAAFAQSASLIDKLHTGRRITVSPTYFLASKIPTNDSVNGIQSNFVGVNRGEIPENSFSKISYFPTPDEKETFYNVRLNYIEKDQISTRFASNLTTQSEVSSLSEINNVRAILKIQRGVENLMKKYIFEYNNQETISRAQTELNEYLSTWGATPSFNEISGLIYSSDRDVLEKILRVKVEIVFANTIERIAIDIVIN